MASRDINTIMQLRVPVIARIGTRRMPLREVLNLAPGALLELPKNADMPMDLMVNNCEIGTGSPVKVGENFGVRVIHIGDAESRIRALAGDESADG